MRNNGNVLSSSNGEVLGNWVEVLHMPTGGALPTGVSPYGVHVGEGFASYKGHR